MQRTNHGVNLYVVYEANGKDSNAVYKRSIVLQVSGAPKNAEELNELEKILAQEISLRKLEQDLPYTILEWKVMSSNAGMK